MTEPPNTAPGWYDDPAHPGYKRWWDGTAWTERTTTNPNPDPPTGSGHGGPAAPPPTTGPPAPPPYGYVPQKKSRTVLKVTLGVILGGCVLLAGCVALLAGGINEAEKEQDRHAISLSDFRSIRTGMRRSDVIDRLGVEPGDAQEFENEGLPGDAVRSSCIYYNEKGKDLGEGRYFQFCFDGGRLTGKNAY